MGKEKRRRAGNPKPRTLTTHRVEGGFAAWLGPDSPFPADIKVDIARVVGAVEIETEGGGTCVDRASVGFVALMMLGLDPITHLGGAIYRAGPDPERDVLMSCTPLGNVGIMHGGHFVGHVWLELDGDIIDFSCSEWRVVGDRAPIKDARLNATKRELGPIRWQREPPSLIWAPRDAFGWKSTGVPKLGEVWYCPWQGELPSFMQDAEFLATGREVAGFVVKNLRRLSLPERVEDARSDPGGYVAKWRDLIRVVEHAGP